MPLTLETPNPYDVSLEDLSALAQELEEAIRAQGSDVAVEVAPVEVHGAGVQYWDLIHVWLPDAEFMKETAWLAVVGGLTAFMTRRFDRPKQASRKRKILIYGPDGEPLKEIEVSQDGTTTDSPAEGKPRRLRRWRQQ